MYFRMSCSCSLSHHHPVFLLFYPVDRSSSISLYSPFLRLPHVIQTGSTGLTLLTPRIFLSSDSGSTRKTGGSVRSCYCLNSGPGFVRFRFVRITFLRCSHFPSLLSSLLRLYLLVYIIISFCRASFRPVWVIRIIFLSHLLCLSHRYPSSISPPIDEIRSYVRLSLRLSLSLSITFLFISSSLCSSSYVSSQYHWCIFSCHGSSIWQLFSFILLFTLLFLNPLSLGFYFYHPVSGWIP